MMNLFDVGDTVRVKGIGECNIQGWDESPHSSYYSVEDEEGNHHDVQKHEMTLVEKDIPHNPADVMDSIWPDKWKDEFYQEKIQELREYYNEEI